MISKHKYVSLKKIRGSLEQTELLRHIDTIKIAAHRAADHIDNKALVFVDMQLVITAAKYALKEARKIQALVEPDVDHKVLQGVLCGS